MRELKYIINDPMGLHARPAGLLVKAAAGFQSDIQIGTAAKMVNARRIMGVMGLVLKQGQEFIMTFDGADEAEAHAAFEVFLKENL